MQYLDEFEEYRARANSGGILPGHVFRSPVRSWSAENVSTVSARHSLTTEETGSFSNLEHDSMLKSMGVFLYPSVEDNSYVTINQVAKFQFEACFGRPIHTHDSYPCQPINVDRKPSAINTLRKQSQVNTLNLTEDAICQVQLPDCDEINSIEDNTAVPDPAQLMPERATARKASMDRLRVLDSWDIGYMRPRISSMPSSFSPAGGAGRRRSSRCHHMHTEPEMRRVRSFTITPSGAKCEGDLFVSKPPTGGSSLPLLHPAGLCHCACSSHTSLSNTSGSTDSVSLECPLFHIVLWGCRQVGKSTIIHAFSYPGTSSSFGKPFIFF